MLSKRLLMGAVIAAIVTFSSTSAYPAPPEQLGYHQIKTDASGKIVPWYSSDPGEAYDHVIRKVWEFWKNMKSCPNGVKYYMQHQVWDSPGEEPRGLGGDQLAMALSSWRLLYAYTGDPSVVENMRYIADYYIAHGLSKPTALWPNLFYPFNMELHSGVYDGDMRAGKGVLQPDKAASFAAELVDLYKITGDERYLKVAIGVADTLAGKIQPGDAEHPPWPYRVNAETGEVKFWYTTNYTGALRLFKSLVGLKAANSASYQKAFAQLSEWLKKYPIQDQKWGPFFEDVGDWSDTEINADTMATYILEHPDWDANWRADSEAILNWSRAMFWNDGWVKYGVRPTNEQTIYPVPANSHTSRHASVELFYAEKSGDLTAKAEAIRALNWATYMVAEDGRNCFPYDMVWLTDGYGDYVRHYLRAMASAPELAPKNQNHLLRSNSVVKRIRYDASSVAYSTFDAQGEELLRLAFTPNFVTAGGKRLVRVANIADLGHQEGFIFNASDDVAGVLRVRHNESGDIEISGEKSPLPPVATSRTISVPENASVELNLAPSDNGAASGKQLTFSVTGPYHGKVAGNPPRLTYTPDEDFLGTDLLVFRVMDGELKSPPAQITLHVMRQDLARLPGARPFTTENPRTGAAAMTALPALTHGELDTSLNAAADKAVAREVSVGVRWPSAQAVRQVILRMGDLKDGSGFFDTPVRLQITKDGSRWQDAVGVTLSPAYLPDARSAMRDFCFTLPAPEKVRGVRVTGEVGKSSKFERVRELEVYAATPSAKPPEIDGYNPQNMTAEEGKRAVFAVRPRITAFVTYQWQVSKDKGQTWQTIPAANDPFYETLPARYPQDNGSLYRCIISNGVSPDSISKAGTLTVAAH
ncbi:MAG TPA: Ig-like domain-containing protein [Terriglobia bacterium]|nr:Ig-like domain-containing protein [Terriglobia bacterium]